MSATSTELGFISEFQIVRDDVMFMAIDAIFQNDHKMSYEEFEQVTDDNLMDTLLDDFLTVDGRYLLPDPNAIISPKYMMDNVRVITHGVIYKMYLCVYDQVIFNLIATGTISSEGDLQHIYMPTLKGVYSEGDGAMVNITLMWSADRYEAGSTKFETLKVI